MKRYFCLFHLMQFLDQKLHRNTVYVTNRFKKYTVQGLNPRNKIPRCLNSGCTKTAEFDVSWLG